MELNNIVGFKAIDADGNEQNVTVDEMVDMVATRMVSAMSETSSLSEISTLATAAATGNDVYENELPIVTDAANVRVLQSSGDAAQMTMQSLATKLGGLIGNGTVSKAGLQYSYLPLVEPVSNINTLPNGMYSGLYYYNITGSETGSPKNKNGSMIMGIRRGGSSIVVFQQIMIDDIIYYRDAVKSKEAETFTWRAWRTLSLT